MVKFQITAAQLSQLDNEVYKALKENDSIIFESVKYVMNESLVLKLFDKYGPEFPEETKESWRERWMDNNMNLSPIKISSFKKGNNKHLLITIIHEAHSKQFMKVDNVERYVFSKWGLKSYPSDVTRHINKKDLHPEAKNIREILKSE